MEKRTRLLTKAIFLGLDLLVGLFVYVMAMKTGFDWDNMFGSLFTQVFMAYMTTGIWIILEWMFNPLHHFKDHDGFGDMISSLLIAPVTYVLHTFGHLLNILSYVKGMLFGSGRHVSQSDKNKERKYEHATKEESRPSQKSTAPFYKRMEKVAGQVLHEYRDSIYIGGAGLINIKLWSLTSYCNWFGGKVTFKGELNVSINSSLYSGDSLESDLEMARDVVMGTIRDLVEQVRTERDGDISIELELKPDIHWQ